MTKEKHAAHEEVTLEVRTLPKPGFSSSMETILRWVLTSSTANAALSFQGNGADLFDILDGTIHWTDADGGGGREGEADQGELEDGKAPKTVPGFTI